MAKTPSSHAVRTPKAKGRATTNLAQPYSDDKNKGRRTGKIAKETERDSDGFEDYDEVFEANNTTPLSNRRDRTPLNDFYPSQFDDDGNRDQERDMSIAMDSSGPNTLSYIAALARKFRNDESSDARPEVPDCFPNSGPAPSSASGHSGSISRRLQSSQLIDYDSIPSPQKPSRQVKPSATQSILLDLNLRASAKPRTKPLSRPGIAAPRSASSSPEPVVSANANDIASQKGSGSSKFGTNTSLAKSSPLRLSYSAGLTNSAVPRKRKSAELGDDESENEAQPETPRHSSSSLQSKSAAKFKSSLNTAVTSLSKTPRKGRAQDEYSDQGEREERSHLPTSPRTFAGQDITPAAVVSDDEDSGNEPDFGGNYDDQGPIDMDYGGSADFQENVDVGGDNAPDEDVHNASPAEQEDRDEDEEDVEPRLGSSKLKKKNDKERELNAGKKKKKGKLTGHERSRSRSVLSPVAEEDEDQEMENDIAEGLATIQSNDEEAAPPTVIKPAKKGKRRQRSENDVPRPPKTKKRAPSIGSAGHVTYGERGTTAEYDSDAPLRRSTRYRHKPLEYWRGERMILGRSDNGPALVPVFKGFLELPKEIPEPLGMRHRSSKKGVRATSKRSVSRVDTSAQDADMDPPEKGMDDDTTETGIVMDFNTGAEIERRLALPAARMRPILLKGPFSFQKIFEDEEFIASGILTLPLDGHKPVRETKDNTYVFFVHSGAVKCTIQGEPKVLAQGGSFIIPRGNAYELDNLAKRETVLFFTQARIPRPQDEDDDDESGTPRAMRSSVVSRPRPSSLTRPRKFDNRRDSASTSPIIYKSRPSGLSARD